MVGIKSYGIYIPRLRMTRALLRAVWGGPAKGERALANHDEDALTMAVDAVLTCLHKRSTESIDAVHFASVSAPYIEKSCAATISAVADLREEDTWSADHGGSLRAGMSAMRAAANAIQAGAVHEALAAAADCRMVEPGNALEGTIGDAAAAFLLGSDDLIATLDGSYSVSAEFLDIWRRDSDRFLNLEDAKFILEKGYGIQLKRALDGLLAKCNLSRDDISKVVFYAPDAAGMKHQAKALKVNPEALLELPILDMIGNAGTAAPLLALAAALEQAKPGDRIVMLGHGDGADAMLFTATDAINAYKNHRDIQSQLASRRELDSYVKYLNFRGLIEQEKIKPFSPYPLVAREQKANLALYGAVCNQCGAFYYPPRRVCKSCDAKDDFSPRKLGKTGTVYTFVKDHLFPTPDSPLAMLSADMDGGGRLYAQLTDASADDAHIGMKVELCFRKLHEGGEHHNYFWKFRPL